MAYICGKNGLIYISGAEWADANAWSISIEKDVSGYSVFGDTYERQCVGLIRWSGSLSGFHDQDGKQLQDAAVATIAVALLIYPDRTDNTTYYNGSALFSFDSAGEVGGAAVTANASFTGSGALTITGFAA